MCNILLAILALICPPLAVGIKVGCSNSFWINLILTFLGFLPGVIHAWYVICCFEPVAPTNVYIHHHSSHSSPPAYSER